MSVLTVSVLSALLSVGQIHADPTIMGAVADGNGEPVAQAEVVFTAGPALDGAVPILERATTDASGRFRLVRPSAERSAALRPRGPSGLTSRATGWRSPTWSAAIGRDRFTRSCSSPPPRAN